jgi:hypothetical protein
MFSVDQVPRTTIMEMLKKEQEIKYSKEIQEIYTIQYKNNSRFNIDVEIQKFILREFHFNDSQDSLKEYWKIPSTYWNDKEVKNHVFYMRHNIFQYTPLSVGESVIDCQLIDFDSKQNISLVGLQTNKPLVIFAGSMT